MFYVYSQSFDLLPKKDCTYVSCSRVLLLTSNKDENFFFFFKSLWPGKFSLRCSPLPVYPWRHNLPQPLLPGEKASTHPQRVLSTGGNWIPVFLCPPPSLPNFSVSSPCWRCHHQCCNKAKAENAFSKSLVTVMTSHSALNTLCS